MPSTLSMHATNSTSRGRRNERSAFEAQGWLVLRRVAGADLLERLTRLFDRLSESALSQRVAPPGELPSVWQLPAMSRGEPALLEHLAGPLIERVACALGATRLQLLQDTLLGKPARGAGSVALHRDHDYMGYLSPPRGLSVRLSLTGGGIEDGCLYAIEGSHDPQLADFPAARLAAATRQIELKPGDVSLHHCRTLHGSYPNFGPKTTKTIIAHVFDGRCRLNRARLDPRTARLFPADARGRLRPEVFPVLFDARDGAGRSSLEPFGSAV
jgi:Phytanoyl-CoA dioxygenase (PhyH)